MIDNTPFLEHAQGESSKEKVWNWWCCDIFIFIFWMDADRKVGDGPKSKLFTEMATNLVDYIYK